MGTAYTAAVGAVPDPRTLDFLAWKDSLIAYRDAEIPLARTTTYYIGQDAAGTSTGGGGTGTEADPWLVSDWDDAATLINTEMASDTRFRLRRGDLFRGTSQVDVDVANVTIDAYGTGSKPYITHFTETVASGGSAWTLDTGTRYYLSEATAVVGLRRQDDRIYLTHGPMAYQASLADMATSLADTHGNWFWDTSTDRLYIDIGENPNSYEWEYAHASTVTHGAIFGGDVDGVRFENLIADGWGLEIDGTASTQIHGIKNAPSGTNAQIVKNCESYLGSSHSLAFNGGGNPSINSGGITTYIGCRSGWCAKNSGGQTVFNSYVAGGDQETIFHDCEVVGMVIPNGTADLRANGGNGFFCHTNGDSKPVKLFIVSDCNNINEVWSGGSFSMVNIPDPGSDIRACRGFATGLRGVWRLINRISNPRGVLHGSNIKIKPDDINNLAVWNAVGIDDYAWNWNNVFEFDLAEITSAIFSAWNPSVEPNFRFWHNRVHVKGNGSTTSWRMSFDTVSLGNKNEWKSNIFTAENFTGAASFTLNEGNNLVNAGNIANNAYFGITGGSDTTTDDGYGNDAGKVELTSSPSLLQPPTSLLPIYNAGRDVGLEYDIYGRPRNNPTPSIGPIAMPGASESETNTMKIRGTFNVGSTGSTLNISFTTDAPAVASAAYMTILPTTGPLIGRPYRIKSLADNGGGNYTATIFGELPSGVSPASGNTFEMGFVSEQIDRSLAPKPFE